MVRNIDLIKTGKVGKKCVSQEQIGSLILKKSKYISSTEQNYFSHFAMRYFVLNFRNFTKIVFKGKS